MAKRTAYAAVYRRLVKLYPPAFRERFGESMLQTFDDLANEERERRSTFLSFTVRLSVDTGIGIVKEHILELSGRQMMNKPLQNPWVVGAISTLLFVPGAIVLGALLTGNEPPVGPLQHYLTGTADGPHVWGSMFALCLLLVLPAAGVMVAAGAPGAVRTAGFSNLGRSAIIGLFFVLPLVGLELVFRQGAYSSFPVPLFAILWLLPALLVAALAPMVQTMIAGKSLAANPVSLVLRLVFILIGGALWIGLLNDQMPCFLGAPNCD